MKILAQVAPPEPSIVLQSPCVSCQSTSQQKGGKALFEKQAYKLIENHDFVSDGLTHG